MKNFKIFFLSLFSIFLTLSFFAACSGDSFTDDLDEDFSSTYTYCAENPATNSETNTASKKYEIGSTLTLSDLPSVESEDIYALKPGYNVTDWIYFGRTPSAQELNPRNIICETVTDDDGNEYSKVTEISVTSAPCVFYGLWKPVTYSVRFNGNGGTNSSGESEETQANFTYDAENTLNENPFSREKYEFNGWGMLASQTPNYPTYSDGETVINLADREGAVVNLYALWLRTEITVKFDSNENDGVGGSVTGEMTDQTLKLSELPQNLTKNDFDREGHTFIGWNIKPSKNDDNEVDYKDESEITRENYPNDDITLYAEWQINSYTVDFDSMGGSGVSSQVVVWNQKAEEPEVPVLLGYDFVGWFTSTDGGATLSDTAFDFSNSTIKENVTFYAKWKEQTLTVKFDQNASYTEGSMADISSFTINDLPVKLTANAFDRTAVGYNFTHWNTKSDQSGYYYYNEYEINEGNWDWVRSYASGDVTLTLYAQWEIIHLSVNFYDSVDGTWISTVGVDWGSKVSRQKYERTGYDFVDWYIDSSCTEKFNFDTPIKANTDIYAKMTQQTLTINLHSNYGTDEIIETVGPFKSDELPKSLAYLNREDEGFWFYGWDTKSDGTGTTYYSIDESNWNSLRKYESGDITIDLYAQWERITYTVNFFDSLSGKLLYSIPVDWENNGVEPVAEPAKTGYEFAGWDNDSTGYGVNNAFIFTNKITGYTEVYAKWNPQTLTVTFNANGGSKEGSVTQITQTFNYDALPDTFTPNGFEKEGYNFAGWNTNASGTGTSYAVDYTVTTANWQKGTLTLYAQWKIKEFKVTFNTNGGTSVSPQTVKWNEKATKPTAPTRTGYTFLGWDSQNNNSGLLESPFDFNNTPITSNITIYAKWKPKTLKITFDGNGATTGTMSDQNISYNALPKNLTLNGFSRDGHDFKGWAKSPSATTKDFSNGEEINDSNWSTFHTSDEINDEITLYAQWEIQKFTVTFVDALDNTELSSQEVEWNTTVARPSEPTKDHYTFADWDSSDIDGETLESPFDFTATIKADTTVYAKWTPDTYTVTFGGNGATTGSMETQDFVYGHTQNLAKSTFAKSGYLFGGWATSSSAKIPDYGDESSAFMPESDMTLYAVWTQRGSISREDGLNALLDEDNEQIVFTAGGVYISYMWVVDNNFTSPYGNTNSITISYDSSYANGQKHSVILISVDENGDTVTESANFTILPKS